MKVLVMSLLLASVASANAEVVTIIGPSPLCLHLETLVRANELAGLDMPAMRQFMKRQGFIGECHVNLPIGTRVRVEHHTAQWGAGAVCIAPLGSPEPCQWALGEAVSRP
jgi:hypothetical protein